MAATDSSFYNLIQFVPQQSENECESQQKPTLKCASETDEYGKDIKHFYETLVNSDTPSKRNLKPSDLTVNDAKKTVKEKYNFTKSENKYLSLRTDCNYVKRIRSRKTEQEVCSKTCEHKPETVLKSLRGDSLQTHSETFKLLQAVQIGELEQASELLKKGASINCQDHFGWTPLMVAAKEGNDIAVNYLLKHGCDHTLHSFDGHTAITLAKLSGYEHIAKIILSFAHTRTEDVQCSATKESHFASDDVHEQSSAAYFCQVCKCEVSSSEKSHETSTVHLFNFGHKSKSPAYLLPETNKGFNMLLKMGWQVDQGLGPHGDGSKYPVKTVLKHDRQGLGVDNCLKKKAKITHFNPNDKSAIEHHNEFPRRQITARKAAVYANRAKEKRDRLRERHLRLEFSDQY